MSCRNHPLVVISWYDVEVEEALRLLASGEALEQMLQVCEQDMAVTDEALSDLRRTGLLSGKRKRGEETGKPGREALAVGAGLPGGLQ